MGPTCQVWLKEKEKGQGGVNGLKKIGPARWPIRFGLVAQENGRLGTRLGGLARAAAQKGSSRTRPTGHGRPITSSPPLLFFAGGFFGPTGHRRPISPPLSSSFHWRAGPAWQRVLLLFLLLSPPPTGLAGARGQGRGLCGGEVKARRGQAGLWARSRAQARLVVLQRPRGVHGEARREGQVLDGLVACRAVRVSAGQGPRRRGA